MTSSSHHDLHAGFVSPQPEFSPVPIWWWSGERVTLDRLCWQLDQLVSQGVHNMVVLNLAPTGPTYGSLADSPELFGDEWWELWQGLAEHARGRGARLWFYDQLGFSGANLQGRLVNEHPEFAGWALEPALASTMEIPSLRTGFDYLSPDACAALLDIVHGEFERRLGPYLGNVIVGSFQDELPTLPTWSPTFADEFARRCGYRIEPGLPALWSPEAEEPAASNLRRDFQRVRGELAEEAFFKPLFEWHERHGMVFGVDQQSPSRAGQPIGSVHQYADYARTHRWFSAPGSDHHGEARIHSSLAHHYGRPRTWIESFHSSGWGGTLEETFDWLVPWLLAGANLYDPHAVYYSTRGGWWEWAPPSTCWRQPYWRHYKHFADAVTRSCWLLTRGAHIAEVGVLFPSATVQAGALLEGALPFAERAHSVYLELVGRMVWYDAKPGVLDECHRDFDVLDDDTVAGASVVDGGLQTLSERYRAIVLPSCPVVEPATARRLIEFAAAGGLLVAVGKVADELVGSVVRVETAHSVPAILERLGRAIDADGPSLHRRVGDRHVLLVPAAEAGSATAQPIIGKGETWVSHSGYDFDPSRFRRSCVVRVEGSIADVEQWDPQSGRTFPAEVHHSDDAAEITVHFDGPSALLVWREARRETLAVAGPWRSELIPTIDNRHGDLALPPSDAPFPVQQWRFSHRRDSEDAWGEVLAGHGQFGWITGPDGERRPLRYSMSRGIEKDKVHLRMLGPKGRVPEEFWQVDDVRSGQSVTIETSVPFPAVPGEIWLAVGTNGSAVVTWNGVDLGSDPGGHLRIDPLTGAAGTNSLSITVTAEEDGALRGYWALTTDPGKFVRPLWLKPTDGNVVGSTVVARAKLELDSPALEATLQLGTEGPARLVVNGTEVAVQGAFEPYGGQNRVLPYDIAADLHVGVNDLEVVLTDVGVTPAVFVDALVELASGQTLGFVTDDKWSLTRNGSPVDKAHRRNPVYDTRWPLLWARPHPLPGARWLEPEVAEGAVLEVIPDARPDEAVKPAEWFRVLVPPGATEAALPIAGEVQASLDGEPLQIVFSVRQKAELDARLTATPARVNLPGPDMQGRILELRVVPEDGRTEGALWDGPIEFTCREGQISPGPWKDAGLGSYSGGVRHTKHIQLGDPGGEEVVLDLGAVRGTAEVKVNGIDCGVRIWSPYRVDVTHAVRPGDNEIEVTVFNTLGPYLDDASPTRYVFPGQRESGMLGPVSISIGGHGG